MGIGTTAPDNKLTLNGAEGIWSGNSVNFYTDSGVTYKGFLGQTSSTSDMMIASLTHGNWMRIGANNSNIAFFPDSTVNGGLNPKVIITATGYLGIGTVNPTHQLQVVGGIEATTLQMTFNAQNGYILQSDAAGNGSWVNPSAAVNTIYTANGTLTGARTVTMGSDNLTFSATSGNLIFNPSATGEVGIGTSAPASLLEIRQDTALTVAPVLSIYNGKADSGYGGAIDFYTYTENGLPASARISAADDGNYSGSILFSTKVPGSGVSALTERVRITDAGKVGIGTSAPGNTLTVNGSGGVWNSNELDFYTDAGVTKKGFIGNYASASDFSMAATTSGNWMRIGANNGDIAFFPDNTLTTGTAPKVIINETGSMGIGTTAPATLLHVNGQVTISDGTQANGNIFTCNASGTGSWTSQTSLNPSFQAYGNPGQIVESDSIVPLLWVGKNWDDASGLNNPITTYTAPSAGVYHFDVKLYWGSANIDQAFNAVVICYVNGVSVDRQAAYIPSSSAPSSACRYFFGFGKTECR